MTYAELMRMSTQIGRRLRQAGARVDQPVAVVMEKGWEQVVGVYAALQAGAPYVPIDPAFPTERIHGLLERSGATQVLTQAAVDARVEWPAGVTRIPVDTVDLSSVDASPLDQPQPTTSLAYLLYTSGSTGEPKGAMLEHRGVVNRMLDVNARYGIGAGDRVIALTALQHDLSVYDLFGTLCAGGTIVVPDAEGTKDPGHWLKLIEAHQISVWNSVPAFMEMLVTHAEDAVRNGARIPQSLRVVILAGDFIPVSLPDRIRKLFHGARVISSGGPTETTIWDIWYPVEHVDPAWTSIPYGKPMANARYHLLKDTLEPCPDWVVGEMYIGGVGLARGYWGDEGKTAERFITHPVTGERLYRSGDMGRMRPDGNIEIIGRTDFQVKIRGFRVELGEIEAALARHEEVKEALVTAVGDSAVSKRLVAYVVPAKREASLPTPRTSGQQASVRGLLDQLHDMPGKLAGAMSLFSQAKPGVTQLKHYLDPIARMEFKTKRLGVRTDTDDRPTVSFDPPGSPEDLRALYLERQSYRRFLQEPLDRARLGALLACLYQLSVEELPFPKGRYPSAGSLYPVQPYLFVKQDRVAGLDQGCYYYDPTKHALVQLTTDHGLTRHDVPPANAEIFDSCGFVILLVGKLGAIEPLYGDLSRQFCSLEAGYMSQLLMEEAPEHGIGLCPSGSILSKHLDEMFVLGKDHVFLHALMGGGIDEAQMQTFQAVEGEPAAPVAAPDTLETRLQKYLRERLPEYMVPGRFVMLGAMPLSPNGKVDRKALPQPDAEEATASPTEVVAARSDVEQAIAKVWQEVLGVETVGIHHNFFDLGGNSIHVVQVHNKIRAAIGADIPIIEMFSNPTIATLAAYVGRGSETADKTLAGGRDRGEIRKALRRRRRMTS